MPPIKRVKFLLIFVYTFSGWIEALLTTNKPVPTMAQLILIEILPRSGVPSSLQSDNRPKFTSQITYCTSPSSSLEVEHSLSSPVLVERANQVLKETLTKLMTKLYQDWTKLLPLALLNVWALPKKPLNTSPFEVMYGRPIIPLGLPPPRTVPYCLPTFLFLYLPRYEMPFATYR